MSRAEYFADEELNMRLDEQIDAAKADLAEAHARFSEARKLLDTLYDVKAAINPGSDRATFVIHPSDKELPSAAVLADRVAELESFLHDEYRLYLRTVCSVVDGVPQRDKVDAFSKDGVEAYEKLLRIDDPVVYIERVNWSEYQ